MKWVVEGDNNTACVFRRFWPRCSRWASAGSDGLSALHHLQPAGEVPLSQPGAGSGESPPRSHILRPCVFFLVTWSLGCLFCSVSACRRIAPCSRRCRPCRTSWTAWGQTTSNCTRRSSSCRATPAEYVRQCGRGVWVSLIYLRETFKCGLFVRCRLEVAMTRWCVTHPSMRRDWTRLPPSAGR